MDLDTLDLQILWHLDTDARLSLAELARRTNSSRQLLNYRVGKLVEHGVIKGFISCVDIHRLGFLTYRFYLRFDRLHSEGKAAVLKHLVKDKQTLWVVETSGPWDVEAVFVCRNFIHFNNLLKDFLATFEPVLAARNISMSPVSYHFKRDYLIGAQRKDFTPSYYGFEPGAEQYDEVDLAILAALSKDCRLSFEDLATAAQVTSQTARVRLERLEAQRIIPAHRILVDLNKLGRRYIKLLVKLRGLTKDIERKLYNFCAKRNYVIYLTEVLGDWQMEIETEIADDQQLAALTRELGESFSRQVADCEVLEVTDELKLDYFPFGQGANRGRAKHRETSALS